MYKNKWKSNFLCKLFIYKIKKKKQNKIKGNNHNICTDNNTSVFINSRFKLNSMPLMNTIQKWNCYAQRAVDCNIHDIFPFNKLSMSESYELSRLYVNSFMHNSNKEIYYVSKAKGRQLVLDPVSNAIELTFDINDYCPFSTAPDKYRLISK